MNPIDTQEAALLLKTTGAQIYELLARANKVRLENRGMIVNLCGVVNAKSGHCTEDCKFCAQSAHNDSKIEVYPLMKPDVILNSAKTAEANKATRFGIVTSGTAVEDEVEVKNITLSIQKISNSTGVMPCASLGNISKQNLKQLKDAGLTRYHCNLETDESFFGEICTTRQWSDSVDTIKAAKELGLATCSGGIFGLGESHEQQVALLAAIRDLNVDSVPLNFYNPVKGTALSHLPPLGALDCLKIVAVARLMMPSKEIRVCGGREKLLGDLQSWALISGADGLMVGGYLTTKGRDVSDDLKMIKDAGFEVGF